VMDSNDIARKKGAQALRKVVDEDAFPRPPAFSDESIALRFGERHASDRRFVAVFGKWFVYDGARWRPDETLSTVYRIRQLCREVAAQ